MPHAPMGTSASTQPYLLPDAVSWEGACDRFLVKELCEYSASVVLPPCRKTGVSRPSVFQEKKKKSKIMNLLVHP